MIDQFGRTIDYMRISITDRCNLRCKYCMPDNIRLVSCNDMLRYEEVLRLCRVAVSLGITKFKITGGEPLVRKGCVEFITELKAIPGVEQVTLTTNGLLLAGQLDGLRVDGLNISIDTLDNEEYCELTGFSGEAVRMIEQTLTDCVARGFRVKINTVLMAQTSDGLPKLAMLARDMPVDVRFIEMMPIGGGAIMRGVPMQAALDRLRDLWPDLHPTNEKRGNGPARYYNSHCLKGRIGFISAVSQGFCSSCNRVRLIGTGMLKPCLCYEEGTDLRVMLRANCTDGSLREAMRVCIEKKPWAHCFSKRQDVTRCKAMNQIGG